MTNTRIRLRGAQLVTPIEEYGALAYDDPRFPQLFDHLNHKYFADELAKVPLRIFPEDDMELMNGRCRIFPTSSPVDIEIHLSDWLMQIPVWEGRGRWDSEITMWGIITHSLLHEMVHLAVDLDALGGDGLYDQGHGRRFTRECNRIGVPLGWGEVYEDDESFPSIHWPETRFDYDFEGPGIVDPRWLTELVTSISR